MPKPRGHVALAAMLALAGCAPAPTDGPQAPADLSRIAGWKGAAVNSPDTFRFVVMSDRTGNHVPGVWARAVEQVNRLRPDFVMCIGDLVEGFEKTPAGALAEWREFDAMVRRLDAPFFYCPGNHDVPNAHYRAAYACRGRVRLRPWHSFDYRGCHFVVFDSTAMVREIPGISEPQWRWLEKDLAAARDARHVFVFEHHPLYHDRGDWMRLRKMLPAGKTTIFSGHEHSLNYTVESGIPYLVLGPTGGFGGEGDWEAAGCHQFAHVTVSDGRPRIAVIPVGHVLGHDLRTGRRVDALRRSVAWGAEFGPASRDGGKVTFEVVNASDVEATYRLTWSGPAEWFAGSPPAAKTLTLGPGKEARRSYRIVSPASPLVAPPAMELAYRFAHGGQPVQGVHRVVLFARAALAAGRVAGVTIDGRLDDWADVPPCPLGARWQVRDNPKEWTGGRDCSAAVRLGYDDENLYLAVDVTDDVLLAEGGESWQRDGVEVFWDPRGPGEWVREFTGPCRQVAVPLPPEGEPARAEVGPAGARPAPRVRSACRRRQGGYTVELAVAAGSIAEGFRIGPGRKLRMELLVNDKDQPDVKAPTACIVLSGNSKASRQTHEYAEVTFK